MYILEVVKFDDKYNKKKEYPQGYCKYSHIGYMKMRFHDKNEACIYYDANNKHMRQLNAHNNFKSDWDPETKLAYIVRKDYGLLLTIEPFNTANSDNNYMPIY